MFGKILRHVSENIGFVWRFEWKGCWPLVQKSEEWHFDSDSIAHTVNKDSKVYMSLDDALMTLIKTRVRIDRRHFQDIFAAINGLLVMR